MSGVVAVGQSDEVLDNPFWHALTGAQSCFAAGEGGARRYARGFSPILGFADPRDPDFASLEAYCDPGERFYCEGWTGPVPAGWDLQVEARMLRMAWTGGEPEAAELPEARFLDGSHAHDALDLAVLTNPGPFGLRTIALGDYLGVFEGPRLLAMAGERVQAGPWREVSGVCTHPETQGRGLARRLTAMILRRQLARGQRPFLHVMRHNTVAVTLYERMGFQTTHDTPVRVVEKR